MRRCASRSLAPARARQVAGRHPHIPGLDGTDRFGADVIFGADFAVGADFNASMTRPHPDEDLARALGWGFLSASGWDRRALIAGAAVTLGRRHRWLGRVVDPVLAAYPRAPADRPYELSRFILGSTPLAEVAGAARTRGRPPRVHAVATAPGVMGRLRWPVPELPDLVAVAKLLELPPDQLSWAADVRGLQRHVPAGPLHTYRHRWIARPGTTPRLLEAPTPLLRAVQRRMLERILAWVPLHPAAHGFVRGRSALTNARVHVGADTVVCLDLRSFFAGLTAARVNGLFRSLGYPEGVAWTLTGLSTHPTPVGVLSGLPAGGDSSARHRLRAALRERHLPQGAPTSPALANLACFGLDRRLAGYAAAAGLTYTRYADDLTFSGSLVQAPRLVHAVAKIAAEEGFALNGDKTRVQRRNGRQAVTGVVTNRQLGVPREDHDQLRAVLNDAVRNGPTAANRTGQPQFREHLNGRVGWVESVNPVRGARLRARFRQITWPG